MKRIVKRIVRISVIMASLCLASMTHSFAVTENVMIRTSVLFDPDALTWDIFIKKALIGSARSPLEDRCRSLALSRGSADYDLDWLSAVITDYSSRNIMGEHYTEWFGYVSGECTW